MRYFLPLFNAFKWIPLSLSSGWTLCVYRLTCQHATIALGPCLCQQGFLQFLLQILLLENVWLHTVWTKFCSKQIWVSCASVRLAEQFSLRGSDDAGNGYNDDDGPLLEEEYAELEGAFEQKVLQMNRYKQLNSVYFLLLSVFEVRSAKRQLSQPTDCPHRCSTPGLNSFNLSSRGLFKDSL